jgi:hypothetical protein
MTEIPVQALEDWLRDLRAVGYAVAKAPDIWANLERGGDWDIVVSSLATSEALLLRHLGPPDRVSRRSYVTAYEYSWGSIDLLPGLYWRGVELATGLDVVAAGEASGKVTVASLPHQVVAACVYPKLAYGAYKASYAALLEAASPSEQLLLDSAMHRIFGRTAPTVDAFLSESPRTLRRAASLRALGSLRFWPRFAHFTYREVIVRVGGRVARGRKSST